MKLGLGAINVGILDSKDFPIEQCCCEVIRARTTFVESFFYFEKKALLRSAGQLKQPDSQSIQNPTPPTSKFNISTTMAKRKPRVDEDKMQEALKDYLDERNKSIAQTAEQYGVNPKTMRGRINGIPAKTGQKAHNRALSEIQE